MTYPDPYDPGAHRPASYEFRPSGPPSRPSRPPRRRRGADVVLWLVLLGSLAIFVFSPSGLTTFLPQQRDVPVVTPEDSVTESAWSLTNPDAAEIREPPDPPDGLREGRDYSFFLTDDGNLVHWGCEVPVGVRIAGEAPKGAKKAVKAAIRQIVAASDLPLFLDESLPQPILNAEDVDRGEIVISFLETDDFNKAAGIDVTEDVLGVGGPYFDMSTGLIHSSYVVLSEEVDPRNLYGLNTIIHELAHAVGLGHSDQDARGEVMRPRSEPRTSTEFGPGDEFALAAVGCS